MKKLYSLNEFCKLTQVSVRTLHYYDEIGLLKPKRTARGHRSYSEADLFCLQQILTFKFLGLSLTQIKTLLQPNKVNMGEFLQLQSKSITQEIIRLKKISKFLHYLVLHHDTHQQIDWQSVVNIMMLFKQNRTAKQQWYQDYLSTVEIQKIKQYENQRSKQWASLFKKIKAQLHTNPEGPTGSKFIKECLALANIAYGNQVGLKEKLWEAYQASIIPNKHFPYDKEIATYLSRAYRKFKQST